MKMKLLELKRPLCSEEKISNPFISSYIINDRSRLSVPYAVKKMLTEHVGFSLVAWAAKKNCSHFHSPLYTEGCGKS